MTTETPAAAPVANAESTELHLPETLHVEAPPEALVERPENPRDTAMRRIAENYEKTQRQHELDTAAEMDQEARDRGEPQEGAEIVSTEPTAQPVEAVPAPAPVQIQPTSAPHRILKIDGREIPIQSEEDLIKLAQLGLTSNQRFQEATRLRDEALASRAQPLQNTVVQPTATPAPVPQAPSTQEHFLDDGKARELARRLSYGSEDDQTNALRELTSFIASRQPQAPQYAPEQIVQAATQNALAQITFRTNIDRIGADFPEIFADRDLTLLAAQRVSDIRERNAQLGRQDPDFVTYREACQLVRDRYAKPPAAESAREIPTAQPTTSTDKMERKRAAPKPVMAASAKASLGPAEKTFPTGAQIVENIRKARGQPSMH